MSEPITPDAVDMRMRKYIQFNGLPGARELFAMYGHVLIPYYGRPCDCSTTCMRADIICSCGWKGRSLHEGSKSEAAAFIAKCISMHLLEVNAL